MTYLLDTCTVSDIGPGVLARAKAMPPNLLAVSALTRMKVNFGLALNAGRMKKLAQALDAFFSALATLPNPCRPSIPTCRCVRGGLLLDLWIWRARDDSNVRPLPSEGSTLSN